MLIAIIGLVLAILIYLPSFWVRRVMQIYSNDLAEIPGTGGELASHLVERFNLAGIVVEETDPFKDHFDPAAQAVRLSPKNYHGKSLTAIAVAAHEVGHAIQYHRKEKVFELRSKYLPTAQALSRAGIAIMWAFPVIAIVLRSPFAVAMVIGASLILQIAGALAYLIILPEEWDASFNKALPILADGEYVEETKLPAIRRILRAAALTYFSAALANVLNIGRWFLLLRR